MFEIATRAAKMEKCGCFCDMYAHVSAASVSMASVVIQRGILAGATIPFIFDTDADPASDKLDLRVPEEWCLENFFNPFTLPLEMFDPQIFHGRGFVQNFLPEEARRRSVLSVDVPLAAPPMEPAPVEPAPADAEAAADEAE